MRSGPISLVAATSAVFTARGGVGGGTRASHDQKQKLSVTTPWKGPSALLTAAARRITGPAPCPRPPPIR